MEKNTLIAIVLSTIVLITFTVLQTVVFPPKAAEEVVKTDKIDSKKVISELVGEQLLKATIDKADFDISNSVLLEVADNFSRKV